MSDQMLRNVDGFVIVYDALRLFAEETTSKFDLGLRLHMSDESVEQVIAFMLEEGLVKLSSADECRVTFQGLHFLQEFEGVRKFLA